MSKQPPPTSLEFTERMTGYIGAGQTNPQRGYEAGRAASTRFTFVLTIRADDVEQFLQQPGHLAVATGYVESDLIGGRSQVQQGTFNLFVENEGDLNR